MIEPRKLPEGTATTTVFSLEPSAWLEKLCEDRDGVVRAWAKKLIYFVAPVNSAAAYLEWKQETDPMFERFTDRARRVMSLAQREARRFNHDHVGVQHVLLGLVKEGSGLAANALQNLGVGLRAVRVETERLNLPSAAVAMPELVMGKLPLTPGCEELVRDAGKASIRLKHKHVGTEHLLLALCGADDASPAVRVLAALGVKRSAVQTAVMELIGDPAKMLKTGNLPAGIEAAALELTGKKPELPPVDRGMVADSRAGCARGEGKPLKDWIADLPTITDAALDAVNERLQEQAEAEKDEGTVYSDVNAETGSFTVQHGDGEKSVAWGFGDNPDPEAWAKKAVKDLPAPGTPWPEAAGSQFSPWNWVDSVPQASLHADGHDSPELTPEVLHAVRGRNYTDRSLKLAIDAAVRLLTDAAGDKSNGKLFPSHSAADAFLEDLFGGPADEKSR